MEFEFAKKVLLVDDSPDFLIALIALIIGLLIAIVR